MGWICTASKSATSTGMHARPGARLMKEPALPLYWRLHCFTSGILRSRVRLWSNRARGQCTARIRSAPRSRSACTWSLARRSLPKNQQPSGRLHRSPFRCLASHMHAPYTAPHRSLKPCLGQLHGGLSSCSLWSCRFSPAWFCCILMLLLSYCCLARVCRLHKSFLRFRTCL
jgi:hypothetical protein